MELVYTSHAKERMAERGITASEVEQAINSPDIHTALAGRVIVVKYMQGRRLEVVTASENNQIIIITAYYAS